MVFCRLNQPAVMADLSEIALPTRFIFVVLSPLDAPANAIWEISEMGRSLGSMLGDKVTRIFIHRQFNSSIIINCTHIYRTNVQSAISLRHILAFPGYALGTIAVNVTWMERGSNAGQKHSSIFPSIFNRLRAVARYWSEIAIFSYPLHLAPPLRVFPLEFRGKVWSSKTRIMGLPGSEDSLTIG